MICTPIDTRLRREIPFNFRRSERRTWVKVFKGSGDLRRERGHGIASAHFICPSKPSDSAIAR